MRKKKCSCWNRNFFLLFCSAMREHLLDFTMAQKRERNAPFTAKTFHLPMASGYENHVQQSCPPKRSQGTKTSEQQTQPICWVEEFNGPTIVNIIKEEKRMSSSISEMTVIVPVNSPSTICGLFFQQHNSFTKWYTEKGNCCHWETLTTGIHGALLRWWQRWNAFVIDGGGIQQQSVWKYKADLL